MSYKKNKQKMKNPIIEFIKSFSVGSVTFVLLIAISSLIIMNFDFPDKYLSAFVFAASAIAAFTTGLFASTTVKQNRLLFGMINIVVITVIHFLVLLCFNNVSLSSRIYLIFPLSLTLGFLGCLTGIKTKK